MLKVKELSRRSLERDKLVSDVENFINQDNVKHVCNSFAFTSGMWYCFVTYIDLDEVREEVTYE